MCARYGSLENISLTLYCDNKSVKYALFPPLFQGRNQGSEGINNHIWFEHEEAGYSKPHINI